MRDEVQENIDEFLQRLKSRDPEDIRDNAEILAQILKSFSMSFGVDIEEIIRIMDKQRGAVNLQRVRNKLFEEFN